MTRLSILPAGSRARVVLLAPQLGARADRLVQLGVTPGAEIELLQRRPAYVVAAGETQLAFDTALARDIFVQRIG
jgi:DtxR family Mn-dependent transcriptional regulator